MAHEGIQNHELSPDDKRYLPRWTVNNRILYQVNDQPIFREGHTKDLNCSGACILVDETLQKDQKINLTIYLTQNQFITVNGQVKWIKLSTGKNLIGVHFHNITENAQEVLLENAFELNKEELHKQWFKDWDGKK